MIDYGPISDLKRARYCKNIEKLAKQTVIVQGKKFKNLDHD